MKTKRADEFSTLFPADGKYKPDPKIQQLQKRIQRLIKQKPVAKEKVDMAMQTDSRLSNPKKARSSNARALLIARRKSVMNISVDDSSSNISAIGGVGVYINLCIQANSPNDAEAIESPKSPQLKKQDSLKKLGERIPDSENPFHIELPNEPRVYTEIPVAPEATQPEEVKNLEAFVSEVQIEKRNYSPFITQDSMSSHHKSNYSFNAVQAQQQSQHSRQQSNGTNSNFNTPLKQPSGQQYTNKGILQYKCSVYFKGPQESSSQLLLDELKQMKQQFQAKIELLESQAAQHTELSDYTSTDIYGVHAVKQKIQHHNNRVVLRNNNIETGRVSGTSTDMFSAISTRDRSNTAVKGIVFKKQGQSSSVFEKVTDVGSDDVVHHNHYSRNLMPLSEEGYAKTALISKHAKNHPLSSERFPPIASANESKASMHMPNKDLVILEGQLKSQMNRITDDKSRAQVSLDRPEILLQLIQVLMKHPLFSNLSMNSVMLMLKHCFAFIFLKRYQILYREGDELALFYLPVYGELNVWNKKQGQFGRVRLGGSAGEEALCDRQFSSRLDNCYAEAESALICISKDSWLQLKANKKADSQLQRDMLGLEDMFRKQHFVKKRWRAGIIQTGSRTTMQSSAVALAASNILGYQGSLTSE